MTGEATASEHRSERQRARSGASAKPSSPALQVEDETSVRRELPAAEDTRGLGERVAALLRPGDLLVLTGPLGAGKTVFAQGVGRGLGVAGVVTSPTFVIARVHRPDPARGGRLPLVHVDAYRLGSLAEVDDLDLDADLEESVTLVEWGEGLVEQLAAAWLQVRIDRSGGTGDERRTVEMTGHGGDWMQRLSRL